MIFLKLGGSVITDKSKERTVRQETLNRLAGEIASYFQSKEALPLLLGHGSGSFGHMAAARHQTHLGASSQQDWIGFSEVWQAAHDLNVIVTQALREAGLPAISLAPSASALCKAGEIIQLATEPIKAALEAGLLPVTYGDVAFDSKQGATIMSTESIFAHLANTLDPDRLLLVGLESGVYADYPARQDLLTSLGPTQRSGMSLTGSDQTDVTGGMLEKVDFALSMKAAHPQMALRILSGQEPGSTLQALQGEPVGTAITNQ